MHITNLSIKNFRLFKEFHFKPSAKINLITGNNGVGKTTLLESIYLLARNKSFRTNNNSHLINKKASEFIVTANITQDSGSCFHVGLKKTSSQTELHIAGQKQKRLSDQARKIPMGIITTHTQKIFVEGPKARRKFLNWGVFHVEHEYADIMSKYNKILLQRNIALRHKIKNYRIWDKQLIDYGLKIDLIRKKYIDVFQQYLEKMTSCYDVLNNINIRYKQGWNRQLSLDEAIASEEDTDLSYTYYGPHRADIGIYIGDVLAYEYLSSGQLKVLAILLILSQLKVTKEIRNESPILLFDDFQSELDHINKDLILSTIRNLHCQAFITSIESNIDFKSEFEGKLFHVEHGEIL